jgi:hypothetical protein
MGSKGRFERVRLALSIAILFAEQRDNFCDALRVLGSPISKAAT